MHATLIINIINNAVLKPSSPGHLPRSGQDVFRGQKGTFTGVTACSKFPEKWPFGDQGMVNVPGNGW